MADNESLALANVIAVSCKGTSDREGSFEVAFLTNIPYEKIRRYKNPNGTTWEPMPKL